MKNLIQLPIIFLFTICLFSCQNDYSSSLIGENYDLVIYDSLNIEHAGLTVLTDYSPTLKMYLLFDPVMNAIILTNEEGKIIRTINKAGKNYDEYHSIRGLGFFEDSQIVVNAPYRIYFYDLEGNYIKTIQTPNKSNTSFTGTAMDYYFNGQQDTIFVYPGKENIAKRPGQPEFYKQVKNVQLYNITNDKTTAGVGFEYESLYKNERTKYHPFYPMFDFSSNNKMLFSVAPLEPKVAVYNCEKDSIKLQTTFETYPDYFNKPKGVAFNKEFAAMSKLQFQNSQTNAAYRYIAAVDDDMLILQYQGGVTKYETVTNRAFSEDIYAKRKFYLQLFKDGEKITVDIEQPSHIKQIQTAIAIDKIIFHKPVQEELPYTTFYIGKLVKKE